MCGRARVCRLEAMQPTLAELRRLATSESVGDRAFASGALALHARTDEARELYEAARACSLRVHAETRAQIRSGRLRGASLRARIDAEPDEVREHWIEEVLDVAYPPLDEPPLTRDLVPYVPSGLTEIFHAVDVTQLGPERTFVDVGAGLGKVAILAALLCGARARGVERDAELVRRAEHAAASLSLDIPFTLADAREADLAADVVYLYTPFTGAVLATVMIRVARLPRPFTLCAQTLDLGKYAWLTDLGRASSWMNVYTAR